MKAFTISVVLISVFIAFGLLMWAFHKKQSGPELLTAEDSFASLEEEEFLLEEITPESAQTEAGVGNVKNSLQEVLDESSAWEDDQIHAVNWERFLQLLHAGANIHEKDSYGRSILMRVVKLPSSNEIGKDLTKEASMRAQAADELLKKGADLEEKDDEGRTVLMLASAAGNAPLVEVLLKHRPNLNAADVAGNTALLLAATPHRERLPGFPPREKISYEGHLQTLRALLRAGADVNVRNKEGKTALMLLQDAHNEWNNTEDGPRREMAKFLTSFGAEK